MCATNSVGEDIQLLSGPWEDFSISKTLQHLCFNTLSQSTDPAIKNTAPTVKSGKWNPREAVQYAQGLGISLDWYKGLG